MDREFMEAQAESLMCQIFQLREKLQRRDSELRAIKAQLDSAVTQCSVVSESEAAQAKLCKKQEANIEILNAKLQNVLVEKDKLKRELSTKDATFEQIQRDNYGHQARIKNLVVENHELETTMKKLQCDLEARDTSLADQQRYLDEITSQLNVSRMAEVETKAALARSEQKHAEDELEWKQKLQILQTQVANNAMKMKELQTQVANDAMRIQELEAAATPPPLPAATVTSILSNEETESANLKEQHAKELLKWQNKHKSLQTKVMNEAMAAKSKKKRVDTMLRRHFDVITTVARRQPAFLIDILAEAERRMNDSPRGCATSLSEWQHFVNTAAGEGRVGQLSAVGAKTEHTDGLQVQPMNISAFLGTRMGVNSIIYRVKHDNGDHFVLKGIQPTFQTDAAWIGWIESHLKQEFRIPAKHMTPHPNIVTIHHCFVASSRILLNWVPTAYKEANAIRDRTLYLVMPHYPINLKRLLPGHGTYHRVSGRLVGVVLLQLLLGVHHMTESRVGHRDLKEDNVCVTANGQLVIIDFGCAIHTPAHELLTSKEQLAQGVGAVIYIAPEIQRWMEGSAPLGHCGTGTSPSRHQPITLEKAYKKAEVFAAGIVAMRTFLGPAARSWTATRPPSYSDDDVPCRHEDVAPPLCRLITCMVRSDPITRASSLEAITALQMLLFGPPPSTWTDILQDTNAHNRLRDFVTTEALRWLQHPLNPQSGAEMDTDGRNGLLGPMTTLRVPTPPPHDPSHPGVIDFKVSYRRLRITWLLRHMKTPGGCNGQILLTELRQAHGLLYK